MVAWLLSSKIGAWQRKAAEGCETVLVASGLQHGLST
jgi:hypothetical protein